MAKYSYGFKLKVVHEYINGEGGYKCLAKKHNIPSCTQIKKVHHDFLRDGNGQTE